MKTIETDVLVITGPTAICPLEVTEVMLDIPADIPSGGGYAIEFHNPAGGNLPYLLTGVELPFTFDYSLNGELPSSGTDPFFGEYQLTGYVYHDANDPSGSICAQSSQSVTVTFHNFEEVDCIDSTEDESFFKNFWSVYPNPARDVVHVECFSQVVSGGHISLMDIQGKRLLEKTFTGSEHKAGIQLDVAGMAPGIYFLRMEVPRGTHTRKLVIGQR